jgi:hypothetical protein
MTATTALVAGQNNGKLHIVTASEEVPSATFGKTYRHTTLCGRGAGSVLAAREGAATCLACIKRQDAPAPAAKAVAAEATREEVTVAIEEVTATAAHTFAPTAGSRSACADCGKTRNAKAHKLAATPFTAEENAALEADAAAELAAEQAVIDAAEAAREAAWEAAQQESPADARSARATELAGAVTAGAVSFDAAAAELLGGAPVETPAERIARSAELSAAVAADVAQVREVPRTEVEDRVEAAMTAEVPVKSWRIGKVLRDFILANEADYDTALVLHMRDRNVCYDGTSTLRLSPAWARGLSAAATDLEDAAVSGDARIATTLRAPSVNAARAARKGLAKLF